MAAAVSEPCHAPRTLLNVAADAAVAHPGAASPAAELVDSKVVGSTDLPAAASASSTVQARRTVTTSHRQSVAPNECTTVAPALLASRSRTMRRPSPTSNGPGGESIGSDGSGEGACKDFEACPAGCPSGLGGRLGGSSGTGRPSTAKLSVMTLHPDLDASLLCRTVAGTTALHLLTLQLGRRTT